MLCGTLFASAGLMPYRFYFTLGVSSEFRFFVMRGTTRSRNRQLFFSSDMFFRDRRFCYPSQNLRGFYWVWGCFAEFPPQKKTGQVNWGKLESFFGGVSIIGLNTPFLCSKKTSSLQPQGASRSIRGNFF